MARQGSKAQLIHANATARAQLISAHQVGGGSAASAPLVHAPTPTPTRWNPHFSPVVEVGGDKKKDKPTGVAIEDTNINNGNARNDGGALTQWRVGNKRFTQNEFDQIMDRGMRGASLNAEQRAVFEAAKKKHDDEIEKKKRIEEEERIRKIKNEDQLAEEKRRNEEWDRRNKVTEEAQIADEKRRADYAKESFDREQAAKDARLQKELDAQNQQRAARNRQFGLPDDYQASEQEYRGLADRTHEYGYSPENQKRVDEMNAEVAKIKDDPALSQEQKDAAVADIQGRIDGIGKAVYKRPDAVAQPQMSTITGDDGKQYRVWSADGKSWQLFDRKDPEVKEPTMNGLTFKDVVGLFKGKKVATGETDDDGSPIERDMTAEEMIGAAQKAWKPDANVPSENTPAPTMGRPEGEVAANPAPATPAPTETNVGTDGIKDLDDFAQFKR